MKKYNVLLSLAAMVMAAGSCGKEQLSENVTHDTDPGFPATEVANTLKAHVEGSELTMAVAESDASGILLAFAEGDQITVFKAADGISAVYSCSAVEAGVATFTVFSGTAPSASDNIVAVYCPGSTPAWVSSSSISITTAAVQSAATSGYSVSSIPLVAYGTAGGDLTFKAVGGVLELSLDVADGDFCSIGSIEVTALGAEDFITGCYADSGNSY